MTNNEHNKHNVNPADYDYVGSFYDGSSTAMSVAYDGAHQELAHAIESLGKANDDIKAHATKGKYHCAACGTLFAHGAVFHHLPTGDLLAIGCQCAANFFALEDRAAVARKAAERDAVRIAERMLVDQRVEQTLADDPELDLAAKAAASHYIVKDIMARFAKYGTMSEKQRDLVVKIAADQAQRLAEQGPEPVSIPVPEGRLQVEGTVLKTKWQESHFGETLKMLVLVTTEEGVYKLWGSVPAAIDDVERGELVRFTATIERSDNDESFGFYKRPSKATILKEEAAA